ncbi:hypothetical protein EZS27_015610 [termite gut metagenome]|uniref:Uncharacterized protein n=1 Tax=termite gut metagenome TaxID=433724 RepID=A0A5J4RRA0_9ZZZZ
MTKKSRIGDIDSIIQNTELSIQNSSQAKKKPQQEELTLVSFELSVMLKKEMNVYCAMNDITIKDFITKAIKLSLEKEK